MDFIIDAIVEWLKGLLVDGIMGNLDGLFSHSTKMCIRDRSTTVPVPSGVKGFWVSGSASVSTGAGVVSGCGSLLCA